MKKKLSLMDVKQALLDERFRSSLPDALLLDVQKFLNNPGCSCNHPIYRKIMRLAPKQLADYYPTLDPSVDADEEKAADEWLVINCHVNELQKKLQSLRPGRTLVETARWQDQVTVVVKYLND